MNGSISHKEKLNHTHSGEREQGQESNLDPHSQVRAPSMASPCLSGGVTLGRISDSQRHTISYHSVNLIIQAMMECETWQTDARVSRVQCKLHRTQTPCSASGLPLGVR